MILELYHLSAYLPWELMVTRPRSGGVLLQMRVFDNKENTRWVAIEMLLRGGWDYYKPVLKPLSDLTRKELEDQGFTTHLDYLTHEHQNYPEKFPICKAPSDMVQYLLSQHYDIFGLLKNHLAYPKP